MPASTDPAPASAPASDKPKWLRKLERESWQAELLISGVALFGSLQLPGLLEDAQHYLLLHYEEDALFLWFLGMVYWVFFAYGLVFLFVYHFVIRALWIGLVGLNSVYPNGFARTKLSSEDLQEKNIRAFGDINGYIRQLDEHASSIFGNGFSTASIFLNLGLIVSVAIFIFSQTSAWGVPAPWTYVLALAPIGVGLTASLLSGFLNIKSLRERDWVKRLHYPMTRFGSWLMYPVNNRFVTTSMGLVQSNQLKQQENEMGKVWLRFAFVLFLMGLMGFLVSMSGVLKVALIENVYFRTADNAMVEAARYADRAYDGIYLAPVLSSLHQPVGTGLEVWVPLPERELALLRDHCSVAEPDEEASRQVRRRANRDRVVACAAEYLTVSVNETTIPEFDVLREYRETEAGRQFGVRLLLTEAVIRPGANTLTVVSQMENPDFDEGERALRTAVVPFVGVDRSAREAGETSGGE